MSQFGLPDPNDNVLEEGNKLESISNRQTETRLVDAETRRRTDSVNISPSGTGRAAFTELITAIYWNRLLEEVVK